MNSVNAVLAVLILSAWGVGEGCGCQTFSVPEDATKIGELDLYVPGATKVPSLPVGSRDPAAPVIVDVVAGKTGPHAFELQLEVDSYSDIRFVFLNFGSDGIYKAPVTEALAGGEEPPTACGVAAEQQGITCTQACLSACACASCSDSQVELNLEQACALNCTLYDRQGLLDKEPYNGSEKTFASVIYNGQHGVPGTATQAGCSTTKCAAAPNPNQKRKRMWSLTFATPNVPELVPLSSTMCQQDTSTPVATSEPFAKAEVRICPHPLTTAMCR